MQPYTIMKRVIHVEAKTNLDVDCINYVKFILLITQLHESIETNKQVSQVIEGERSSITYLIQRMKSF